MGMACYWLLMIIFCEGSMRKSCVPYYKCFLKDSLFRKICSMLLGQKHGYDTNRLTTDRVKYLYYGLYL